ncbi:MAG: ATP-binding protein [Bdellovibrio sp.]
MKFWTLGARFLSPTKWVRIQQTAGLTLLGLFLGWIIADFQLDRIEFLLFDERIENLPQIKVSGQVVLAPMEIDASAIVGTSKIPVSLNQYQEKLGRLLEAEPAAVVSLIPLEDFEYDPQQVSQFVAWAQTQNSLYLTTSEFGNAPQMRLAKPFHQLKAHVFPLTRDERNFAQDKVTRRALLAYLGKEYLHLQLAQRIQPELKIENLRGVFDLYESKQIWLQFPAPQSFPNLSLSKLDTETLQGLKNKIVLVGLKAPRDFEETAETPLSKGTQRITAAEAHAIMIENILQNSGIRTAPEQIQKALVMAVSVGTLLLATFLSPLQGLGAVLGLLIGLVGLNFFIFAAFDFWLHLAESLISIFVCYYFVIPYRLIRENKKRWEIEQKHQILSQVEELKTNFISMMSHDLKTPLARIQGMIELIRRDPTPLSLKQIEGLDVITSSSGDLLGFIETILNYANLESKGVQLQLAPTDLNQILSRVLAKHEFLAKAKHVDIQTDLEPLFSLQLDARLIEQVFSNLLDNALKYSPEKSRLRLRSWESENRVWVSIEDQGPGIPPEELSNIFQKFYRSKSAKSSPIKGSGLGLYLARYFVELHQGSLELQSKTGQGSTFTVNLPLDLKAPIREVPNVQGTGR